MMQAVRERTSELAVLKTKVKTVPTTFCLVTQPQPS